METPDTGRCPKCGRKSYLSGSGSHCWYCHYCQMEFEDIDDGDLGYGQPSKRLERQEARSTLRPRKTNGGNRQRRIV